MTADDVHYCYAFFVYDDLCVDSIQEKSRKELEDDSCAEISRGSSELHRRALLVR